MSMLHAFKTAISGRPTPEKVEFGIAPMYLGRPVPYSVHMPIAEWLEIPVNPRQRDTFSRMKKSLEGHLNSAFPTHAIVTAAKLPGGDLVKLDGHTRSEAWAAGHLTSPSIVLVNIIPVENMDEARLLYTHYDSDLAVERTDEKLSGAARESGIVFTSPFCLSRKYANALRYASGKSKANVYDYFHDWEDELVMLDGMNVNQKQFNSGVTLAVLMTFRRAPTEALAFWGRFKAGDGVAYPTGRDAISRMTMEIERIMTEEAHGGGRDRMFAVAQCALYFFEKHLENPGVRFKSHRIGKISISDYRVILAVE